MMRVINISAAVALLAPAALAGQSNSPACDRGNGGITLPAGFCATLFADSVAGARHLVVAPNGDVFVSTQGRSGGGVTALRDGDRDGHADRRVKFARGFNSSEVALFDGHLYTETTTGVLRFPLKTGSLEPSGPADTVVSGLPGKGHFNKTFTIARDGSMYLNVGSRTNSCQKADRAEGSPGVDPCKELETRAGIWKFDARKLHQTQRTGQHFARGIRNAVGIAIRPSDGTLWATQHGRDQLGGVGGSWPRTFNQKYSSENPAEELLHVVRGDDFGWPYCYYSTEEHHLVLGPEYGGNGHERGRCSSKKEPVAVFPAHWAPNALLFYTGSMFPARYKSGAFIAFHGSWNRAPLPQGGFNVVFQPLRGDRAGGDYEVFADGFASNVNQSRSRGNARPAGLAQGPDGALYIADDATGRIWKVVYTGSAPK